MKMLKMKKRIMQNWKIYLYYDRLGLRRRREQQTGKQANSIYTKWRTKRKKAKIQDQNIYNMWDNINWTNIWVIRDLKEKRDNGVVGISEEIMTNHSQTEERYQLTDLRRLTYGGKKMFYYLWRMKMFYTL